MWKFSHFRLNKKNVVGIWWVSSGDQWRRWTRWQKGFCTVFLYNFHLALAGLLRYHSDTLANAYFFIIMFLNISVPNRKLQTRSRQLVKKFKLLQLYQNKWMWSWIYQKFNIKPHPNFFLFFKYYLNVKSRDLKKNEIIFIFKYLVNDIWWQKNNYANDNTIGCVYPVHFLIMYSV
jgi:hypothetical protein